MSFQNTPYSQSYQSARFSSGSIRELFAFSFPLILSLLSQSVMLFCDRYMLSHYSIRALDTCTAAQALCILFQLPCIRITSMGQVFVGEHVGASRLTHIGPMIWQMIWFSLISMLVTLPLGSAVQSFFFNGSSIQAEGHRYFNWMMGLNFLFPLESALVCFYLGLGKNKIVICTYLVGQGLHLLLDGLLIYGIDGLIPSMGVMGAAVATLVSQGETVAK